MTHLLFTLLSAFTAFANPALRNYECQTKANSHLDFPRPIHVWVAPPQVSGRIVANAGQANVTLGIVMEVEDLKPGDTKFRIILNLFRDYELSGITDPSKVSTILVYTNHAIYNEESSVYRYFSGEKQVGGTLVVRGSPIACLP